MLLLLFSLFISVTIRAYKMCASYGVHAQCTGWGGVTGTCGSGKNPDCADVDGCGSNTYQMVDCNLPWLSPYSHTKDWEYADYGERLSCPADYFISGMCGSGKNADCNSSAAWYEIWNGKYYIALQCSRKNGFTISSTQCYWYSHSDWGKPKYCNSGYVGVGYCGSGENKDCDGKPFKFKCCKYTTTLGP